MKKLIVAAAMLLASAAYADTNLPVVCGTAGLDGQVINNCAAAQQTFARATPTSLVRTCNAATCAYGERVWRQYAQVTDAQFVEVCTADKPLSAPAVSGGECRGTTSTTWGAMQMVPKATVAVATGGGSNELPGTFTVTPSSGVSPLTTTIAWDITLPAGTVCTASGSWTGTKPLRGTQTVNNITASATYTLSCAVAASTGRAVLTWVNPTQNTDGTALTNLAGTRIYYGTDRNTLATTVQVTSPTVTTYTVQPLESGTWYFAVKAYNTVGAESALSNIVSKVVSSTPAVTYRSTREVTVTTQPNPPVLTVDEPVAGVRSAPVFNHTGATRGTAVLGFVDVGSPCLGDPLAPILRYRDQNYWRVPRSNVKWWKSSARDNVVAPCSAKVEG